MTEWNARCRRRPSVRVLTGAGESEHACRNASIEKTTTGIILSTSLLLRLLDRDAENGFLSALREYLMRQTRHFAPAAAAAAQINR